MHKFISLIVITIIGIAFNACANLDNDEVGNKLTKTNKTLGKTNETLSGTSSALSFIGEIKNSLSYLNQR